MLWVPRKGRQRVATNLSGLGSASPGTSVTTGASASTKGAVAELIASVPFDAYWLSIIASGYGTTAAASEGAMDILIGAATEEVLIPNLLFGYCGADQGRGYKTWEFPLYIPAGSRISCQAAGARVSTAFAVAVVLYGGDGVPLYRVGSKVVTYGMGTVPDGTPITPGGSGAEGAWTQIAAATSEDHFAFVPSFQNSGDAIIGEKHYSLDLGIGAAPEELIGVEYLFATDAGEHMAGPFTRMPTFQDVPSGTRLVMRVSNNGTNDDGYNAVIHAVS